MTSLNAAMVDGTSTAEWYVAGELVPCINASPSTTPNATSSGLVTNGGTAYLAHGFVLEGDRAVCPPAFDDAVQSSLGFSPKVPASATVGTEFLLGEIVHHNNVLDADPNLTYHMTGKLRLEMGGFQDEFAWNLTETANKVGDQATPVDDVTVFTNPRSTQIVTGSDGMSYRLVINGFISTGAEHCPATRPAGDTTDTFVTPENATTYGCVYASWEQERPVTIVKVAENNSGVAPAIPAFNYDITVPTAFAPPSDLWRQQTGWNDFSLQPTAFGAAGSVSVTNELLVPIDGIRVTEQIEPYDPDLGGWRLAEVACVTGNGQPVLDANGAPVRADAATGQVDLFNLGLATAADPAAPTAADAQIIRTYTNVYEPMADLEVVKTINGEDANEAPGVLVQPATDLDIAIKVTNTGQKTLTNLVVTDSVIAAADIVAPTQKTNANGALVDWDGVLLPGESVTYTATVPAPGLGGTHTNTATVTATPEGTTSTVTDDDPANAHVGQAGITLVKSHTLADTNSNGWADAGEVVTYTFTVTNTGQVNLAPVTITDAKLGITDEVCVESLAAGATAECVVEPTYTVTGADVAAAAPIHNVATATGTAPEGTEVTDTDDEDVPTGPAAAPGIELDKWALHTDSNGNSKADAGEKLVYYFDVTNTGNVLLAPVTITDARFNLTDAACVDALEPGETATCSTTVTYIVTAADVAAQRDLVNTAIATGTPPSGPKVTSQDTVNVPVGPAPKAPPKPADKPTALPRTGSDENGLAALAGLGFLAITGLVLRRRIQG